MYTHPHTARCALQFTIAIIIYYHPYRLKPTNKENKYLKYTFESNPFSSDGGEISILPKTNVRILGNVGFAIKIINI